MFANSCSSNGLWLFIPKASDTRIAGKSSCRHVDLVAMLPNSTDLGSLSAVHGAGTVSLAQASAPLNPVHPLV